MKLSDERSLHKEQVEQQSRGMREKMERDRELMLEGLAERQAELTRQRDDVNRMRREEDAKVGTGYGVRGTGQGVGR